MKMKTIIMICVSVFTVALSVPIHNRNEAMEVTGLFEGDIKLLSKSKGLLTTAAEKWPNGIVPYTINTLAYTSAQLTTITNGMRLIENQVGSDGKQYIKFIPRTTEKNFIHIESLDGCWSYVGMYGGNQTVSLQAGGCTYIGTVAHELIHALGFYHEQSRADRDDYVTINFQNIQTGRENNFQKITTNYDYQGINYDIYSIMHYGAYAFSSNSLPTITPKQAGITLLDAYQKTSLSSSDIEELRRAYPVKVTQVQLTTTPSIIISYCQSSPCRNNAQCASSPLGFICICPITYTGIFCEIYIGPATTTTSTTTTTVPIVSNCVNLASDAVCTYFSGAQFNYCNRFDAYLGQLPFRDACKKTCNLCSSITTCVDTQQSCQQFSNYCYLLDGYNPHPCPKTCNKCPNVTTKPPCVDNLNSCASLIFYCNYLVNANPHPCAKTCNVCR